MKMTTKISIFASFIDSQKRKVMKTPTKWFCISIGVQQEETLSTTEFLVLTLLMFCVIRKGAMSVRGTDQQNEDAGLPSLQPARSMQGAPGGDQRELQGGLGKAQSVSL